MLFEALCMRVWCPPAGADGTLAMWDVCTKVLDAQAAASVALGPERWHRVLDNPDLLEELRDYFTYAQVGRHAPLPTYVGIA